MAFVSKSIQKALFAAILSLGLAACSSESDTGQTDATPFSPVSGDFRMPFTPEDFRTSIHSESCIDSFAFTKDWQDELTKQIQFGNAPCVKKVLSLGAKASEKINVSPFERTLVWPVHYALSRESLFFAKGAIDRKGFEVIKALVEAGADLNAKNESNETALHVAIESDVLSDHPIAAAYIIQSGKADLESLDGAGNTPLVSLLTRKENEAAKMLLQYNANPHAKTRNGQSTLQLAIQAKAEDIALELLDKNLDPLQTDRNGNNSLHWAATYEMLSLTRAILAKGVSPDIRNNDLATALLRAVWANANEVAKELVSRGADVNLSSKEDSPLHASLRANNDELAGLLIPLVADVNTLDSQKSSPLALATRHTSTEHVRSLLARGADASIADRTQTTPLMYALQAEQTEKIVELLEVSDVNLKGPDGQTAIFFARNVADLRLLLSKSPNLSVKDNKGTSPLSRAVSSDQTDLALALIDSGADVKWSSLDQEPLLHNAIRRGNAAVARSLLDRGADANGVDAKSETALFNASSPETIDLLVEAGADVNHLSLKKRSVLLEKVLTYLNGGDWTWPLIVRLIDHGANVDITHSEGQSLLHLAITGYSLPGTSSEYLELAGLLIKKGANVNAADASGRTPLHLVDTEAEATLLLLAKPRLSARSFEGKTPLEHHESIEDHLDLSLRVLLISVENLEKELVSAKEGSVEFNQLKQRLEQNRAQMAAITAKLSERRKIIAAFANAQN